MNDPAHPLSYLLTRLAAWLPVTSLPPAAEGKTRIPPPAASVKDILDKLYASADWKNLIHAAETRVTQFIFWLDLSRMVYRALGNLGERCGRAQEVVSREAVQFTERLAGIEDLAFSDGTPFADDDTKQWLKEIAAKGAAGEAEPMAIPSGSPADSAEAKVAEAYEKARKLVKAKKLSAAVGLLEENVRSGSSARIRLVWRLALSRLLIDAKKANLAVPHLKLILRDIDRYQLEEWDPALALQGLKLAYFGLQGQPDDASQARASEVLEHIAGLSPSEALKVAK